MPNHQKLSDSAHPGAKNGAEVLESLDSGGDPLKTIHTALDKASVTIDYCIDTVTTNLKALPYDSKLASHLIYLAEGAAKVLGELRKLELSAKSVLKNMTPDESEELLRALVQEMPSRRFKAFRQWVMTLEENA